MGVDVATLMLSTTLMLVLSTAALVAHWLANREAAGLGRIAGGVAWFTFGFLLLLPSETGPMSFTILLGSCLILFGHLWLWLGVAENWNVRSRNMSYVACGLVAFAIVSMTYRLVVFGPGANRTGMFSFYVAILSIGTMVTLVSALGGRVALYKGIIKRKTIAPAIATGLFAVHGLFHLYRAYAMNVSEKDVSYLSASSLATLSQAEAMVFAISLALAVIIMTAERVQADLTIQAMMDPLTEALNRRAFMTVVKTVLARSRRMSEPVSLIMMDIDKFKKTNLQYGHMVGDAILHQFSEQVMAGRRAQDVFCRFGGEEFVLLLPGTPEEGAELVANRVRAAITDLPFVYTGKEISLTVSFGVMTARGDDLEPDGMLDSAYKALRSAQKAGNNRIKQAV